MYKDHLVMSFKTFFTDLQQIRRIIVTALYTVGSAVAVYHLFAFKGDKFGIYYRDGDQYWLAFGVGMLVLGYFIKNWNK